MKKKTSAETKVYVVIFHGFEHGQMVKFGALAVHTSRAAANRNIQELIAQNPLGCDPEKNGSTGMYVQEKILGKAYRRFVKD